MAKNLQSLLWALDMKPAVVVGHSAGVAIALRMALDGAVAPGCIVGLNAAIMPLGGSAGQLFSPLAKFLVGVPGVPSLFSWRARDRAMVERLLEGTGSRLDAGGVGFYARVVQEPAHAASALAMMAYWDLRPLVADLPKLRTTLLLVVGEADRAIPPADSARVVAIVPGARLHSFAGLGHLAHEEAPEPTAALIEATAREAGILPA